MRWCITSLISYWGLHEAASLACGEYCCLVLKETCTGPQAWDHGLLKSVALFVPKASS